MEVVWQMSAVGFTGMKRFVANIFGDKCHFADDIE